MFGKNNIQVHTRLGPPQPNLTLPSVVVPLSKMAAFFVPTERASKRKSTGGAGESAPNIGFTPASLIQASNNADAERLNTMICVAKVLQDNRAMWAQIYRTGLCPKQILADPIQVSKAFGGSDPSAPKGNAFPHVWMAFLVALMECEKVGEQEKQIITAYVDNIKRVGAKEAEKYVTMCRVKEARDPAKALIYWCLSTRIMSPQDCFTLDQAIIKALEIMGGDVRTGQAPPTHMERVLSKDITALKEKVGR
jgi:hypothetical protein